MGGEGRKGKSPSLPLLSLREKKREGGIRPFFIDNWRSKERKGGIGDLYLYPSPVNKKKGEIDPELLEENPIIEEKKKRKQCAPSDSLY